MDRGQTPYRMGLTGAFRSSPATPSPKPATCAGVPRDEWSGQGSGRGGKSADRRGAPTGRAEVFGFGRLQPTGQRTSDFPSSKRSIASPRGLVLSLALWILASWLLPPAAWAQPVAYLYLPLLLQETPVLPGQVVSVSRLASAPQLLLLNLNPVAIGPAVFPSEPWISEDGGGHWSPTSARPWLAENALVHAVRVTTALVDSPGGPVLVTVLEAIHAEDPGGWFTVVYTSTDLGHSWTRRSFGTEQGCPILTRVGLTVTPAAPDVIYIQGNCVDPDEVPAAMHLMAASSVDQGAHWITLPTSPMEQPTVLPSPVQPDDFFASDALGEWWRTSDRGAQWRSIGPVPPGTLQLSPSDPDRLLSTTRFGAFVSADFGDTWIALNGQPCDPDVLSRGWEVAGPHPVDVFPCADGRWIATRDDGHSWEIWPAPPWDSRDLLSALPDPIRPGQLWVISFNGSTGGLWKLDVDARPRWTAVLRTKVEP